MKIIHTSNELKTVVGEYRRDNKSVGFVPTLGALHDGHMSLIHQSITKCDFTICSVFVNPTQFDDAKDLEKYPRTLQHDEQMLEANGCDVLFLPSVTDVYPNGTQLQKNYELGELEFVLEGATRPGHYQGVAQVVHRLLELVEPDRLFLGQKDYQQVMILKRMIKHQKLNVRVNMCNIIRDDDGLAKSSRNRRLSNDERKVANELYKTLKSCKQNVNNIPIHQLKQWAVANLNANPLIETDYISFRDAKTFNEIEQLTTNKKMVILGAIFLGPIRLIDNLIIH